jgi:hypothetical protein
MKSKLDVRQDINEKHAFHLTSFDFLNLENRISFVKNFDFICYKILQEKRSKSSEYPDYL